MVQDGRLELDGLLPTVLPVMEGTDKAGVTLRQLLTHTSGWPAWQPYFERLRQLPPEERRPQLARFLSEEPLTAAPGMVSLYSDLDFLALGLVVEACSGMRLDRFVRQEVYRTLGLVDLFFNPLDEPPAARRYAATEQCPWRGRVLRGIVHDDNAYTLNGVAGHAGLFGTAAGIHALLQALLKMYHGEGASGSFSRSLVQTMWTRVGNSGWALGFDTPAAHGSSSGRHFSSNSVGHLGFTGTSFWLDLDRRIMVVLLTNRVHPSRSNVQIRTFRPRIHDAIMEWLLQSAH
jgi:CubicO group peptidase (beta-lactamase class C family)